ncbi:ABC transporter substrate-binding protein [Faecalicatena orotica]|uniref:ABC transporter substrate-binding protein n=1 Tax=Faecalicatena orotica TaxID=1544 RepID=UPI0032165FE1
MKKRLVALFLAGTMAVSTLAGCSGADKKNGAESKAETDKSTDTAKETGELTLYYSNSTDWADPIIQEFEDQTGITVNLVQDGTSSLFARIKAEAGNPQADVVWGGVIDTYRANQDLLQKYTPSTEADLKEEALDPNGYYTGFDMGPMVMVYNTELVDEADAPTKWSDLLEEKYKGQIACADPTSSSSSFACAMAIMLAYGTEDGKGYDFIEKLVKNLDGKVIDSSSGVYKGVADGEYMVGLTYEEAALRYIESGATIGIVYPEEGTSSSPSGCAVVKDCQNQVNAQKFIDYLSSKEVQAQLGDLNRRSVRTDVSDPDTMKAWDEIKFVDMDLDWTSSHVDEFNEKWTDFVTE